MMPRADEGDLKRRQREREEQALAAGAKRYWNRLEGVVDEDAQAVGVKRRSGAEVSATRPGQGFIRRHITDITTRLTQEREKSRSGEAGRGAVNMNGLLLARSLEDMAYLALKSALDYCIVKKHRDDKGRVLRAKLIGVIGREGAYELEANRLADKEDSYLIDLDQKITKAKGREKERYERRRKSFIKRKAKVDLSSDETSKRLGLVLYSCLVDAGLIVEFKSAQIIQPVYCSLSEAVINLVDAGLESAADASPLWSPLVIPPRDWQINRKNAKTGGYHYALSGLLPFMKRAPRGFSVASCPEVVAAVNAVQRTAYRINSPVIDAAEAILALKDDELNYRFFGISRKSSPTERKWQLFGVIKTLREARRCRDESAVYFVHTIDFRGRIYPQATYLNPQGSDLSRALVTFAEGKPIADENAERWLANHGACCYGGGLSRKTYAERVAWVDENEEYIHALASDPQSMRDFWQQADKPWGFLAWCREWSAFKKAGRGYVSCLPVAVDGTCNGFQHFAALTRSSAIAAHVNILPAARPRDLYQVVADSALTELDERARHLTWFSDLSFEDLRQKYVAYTNELYRLKSPGGKKKEEEPSVDPEGPAEATPLAEDEDDQEDDGVLLEADDRNSSKALIPASGEGEDEPDEISSPDNHNREAEISALLERKQSCNTPKARKHLMSLLGESRRQLALVMLYRLVYARSDPLTVDRKLLKNAVMTFPYSATHSSNALTICQTLQERGLPDCSSPAVQPDPTGATPGDEAASASLYSDVPTQSGNDQAPLGSLTKSGPSVEMIVAHALTRIVRAVINREMGDAVNAMNYLKALLPGDRDRPAIDWTSPSGLRVVSRYWNMKARSSLIKLQYVKLCFFLYNPKLKEKADLSRHRRAIAPNFVHSIDAAHLTKTVNAVVPEGINAFLMVHDSYATHAADMEVLARALREQFSAIYSQDLLEQFRQEMLRQRKSRGGSRDRDLPPTFPLGDLDPAKVLDSSYFFS